MRCNRLKQSVSRTLALRAKDPFWQARYYDFNVWSERNLWRNSATFIVIRCTGSESERPQDWSGVAFVII